MPFKSGYYEGDINNRMKLSCIMRRMQQAGSENLDAFGQTADDLSRLGLVFLLAGMELHIKRMPVVGEALRLATMPLEPVKARFIRYYDFTDERGETIIKAISSWLLFDFRARRVLRPSAYPFEARYSKMREASALPGKKIAACGRMEPAGTRRVRFSDIDCNGHMNNSVYADVICDFMPPGLMLQRELEYVLIEFKKECVLNDLLEIKVGAVDESTYEIIGTKGGGNPCFSAMIGFGGVDAEASAPA